MNMPDAMALLENVIELETIARVITTPDGRWELLQAWLGRHPAWKAEVNKWIELTPEEAFNSLRDFAAKKAGMPAVVLAGLISPDMRRRITGSIQIVQTLYRERQTPAGEIGTGFAIDDDPTPSAHKTINDYQRQLKAKKKRPPRRSKA